LTFSTSNTDNNPDSGGNGGGVFIVNAELVMHGGTITGNSAGRNGGGIYVVHSNSKSTSDQSDDTDDTAASVTIDAGTISGNTAEKRGGAVSMDTYDWKYYDADGNVTSGGDGTFQSAGCGLTSSDAALTVTFTGESLIAKNEAEDGGGFYVGGGKLTVDGGVIRYNTASATQDEIDKANDGYKLTTAYDANKNIGVGGGIYVYHAGTLVLNSSGASGVYSNTASFAADDLYCSRASNSEISIPDVTDMALEDYKGNVVGHAIGWYEDYPKDDTYYSNRDTTYVDSDQLVLKEGESVIRYRVALAYYLAHLDVDADSVEGRRVLYNVSKDHLTTVNGYVALTLGYELTRYDLTVKKMVDSDDTDAPSPGEFTFTVTITGAVAESDLTAKDSYGNFYETAKLHIYPNDSKYSIDHDEQDEREADGTVTKKGYATVTFKLKAGESVTLEGIPVGAKVVVTEEKTANYVAKYTTEGGKELSGSSTYTIDQIDGNTSIVCVNTLVYTLPSTGGSGTLIYTISGMVLCATAVVFWNRRRRRAH
jgi:LPXTG-motif cell wall-anchored protein